MEWEDVYPEMVNKIRWAIVSTLQGNGGSISYSEGQSLATVVSQDIMSIAKVYERSGGVLASTGSVREFWKQEKILAEMDEQMSGKV